MKEVLSMHEDLKRFINECNERKKGVETFYYDLETFTVNREAIKSKPTEQKSYTYSFACSFFLNDGTLCWDMFPCFRDFFEFLKANGLKKQTSAKKIRLIAHNAEKYDNHFLRWELVNYYHCKSHLLDSKALNTIYIQKRPTTLQRRDSRNIMLESRVRASTRLELHFNLDNYVFETVDSYLKTGESLAQGGYKLLNHGLIDEKYLKTSLDYNKYDSEKDLRIDFLEDYRNNIFENLTEDEKIYIRNDVILLAHICKNYSKLYYGFDFENRTKTQGIMKSYTDNENTDTKTKQKIKWQLLKEYNSKKDERLNLSEYRVDNLSAFDYFRRFYKGGLNLYNDKYNGKIQYKKGFSIDINSSYPTIMFNKKLPYCLEMLQTFERPKFVYVTEYDDSFYSLFTMREEDANRYIINKLKSKVLKNAIVKYYNAKAGQVYLNNVIIEELERIEKVKFGKIPVTSIASFSCDYFAGRDIIAYYYFIKTQGKLKDKLETNNEWYKIDPSNIKVLEGVKKPDEFNYTADEVAGAKVNLNGLYGIPALSASFDCFRVDELDKIENINGGRAFHNKERNIVFSTAVTSYAFANLISCFEYLTPAEIDEYFWYADTDSLYMDERALNKIPQDTYHFCNLGKWDIEHRRISAFYSFNHKKYCLIDEDNPTGSKIVVRCGGVEKNQVKKWIDDSNDDIEYFVNHYFKNGTKVKNTRSLLNRDLTISIYEGYSELSKGGEYLTEYDREVEKEIEKFIEEFKKSDEYHTFINNDMKYFESSLGTISYNDFLEDRPLEELGRLKSIDRLIYDYHEAIKKVEGR